MFPDLEETELFIEDAKLLLDDAVDLRPNHVGDCGLHLLLVLVGFLVVQLDILLSISLIVSISSRCQRMFWPTFGIEGCTTPA